MLCGIWWLQKCVNMSESILPIKVILTVNTIHMNEFRGQTRKDCRFVQSRYGGLTRWQKWFKWSVKASYSPLYPDNDSRRSDYKQPGGLWRAVGWGKVVSCRSRGGDEEWHGVPAAAGPWDKSVLMQDFHSSHSEVALSWTAMMTATQSAGLSTAAVQWRVCVCVCVWCKCVYSS